MEIFGTMLTLGLLLGFVGAGGAGVVIAVLVVFRIPIHTALGTSLSAMAFTTLSGTYSHYREGNVMTKSGMAIGIFGAIGAFIGAKISALLPPTELKWLTACMMYISAILIYCRMFRPSMRLFSCMNDAVVPTAGLDFWLKACKLGLITGLLSGTFGIGATPFIQLGLLLFFNMSIHQAVGTTMLVTLPIALLGGFGYLLFGFLDMRLFAEVVLGLMAGAFVGAKFTRRMHPLILKLTMVLLPVIGGTLILTNS